MYNMATATEYSGAYIMHISGVKLHYLKWAGQNGLPYFLFSGGPKILLPSTKPETILVLLNFLQLHQ